MRPCTEELAYADDTGIVGDAEKVSTVKSTFSTTRALRVQTKLRSTCVKQLPRVRLDIVGKWMTENTLCASQRAATLFADPPFLGEMANLKLVVSNLPQYETKPLSHRARFREIHPLGPNLMLAYGTSPSPHPPTLNLAQTHLQTHPKSNSYLKPTLDGQDCGWDLGWV